MNEFLFTDEYDEVVAKFGPPSLFTLTYEGELQLDVMRTRDWRRRFWRQTHPFIAKNSGLENPMIHLVCVDAQTRWPTYVLLNAEGLIGSDVRTQTEVMPTYKDALNRIEVLKQECYLRGKERAENS